ncbi:MAG: hypothetical protein KGD63_14415 [Candidatus Lokiarchaeota archaeon]|nr:hypothetical protein [Candidatus Lokiarchaeota archaeon]
MKTKKDALIKYYRCNFCNATHEITIKKSILDGQSKYPFPYVFLHDSMTNGDLQELLTILYIDSNGKIRGTEIQKLGDNNLFSKEQVFNIVKPLVEEIERLQEDHSKLTKQIEDLKTKS